MKVVGVDFSLVATGVAVHTAGGETYTRQYGRDGHKGEPLRMRRDRIHVLAGEVLFHAIGADLVVVESHDFGMKVSALSHDRSGLFWITVNRLMEAGVMVAQATPQTLKMYQTGAGNASKQDMLVAAVKRYPTVDIRTDNMADAMAALSMGVRHLELAPLETVWNAKMEQAMSKVEWPV
jgi:crossover junction endodeoxyribonuclease RuvC